MNWNTRLPSKKTDLRLIVACGEGRNKTYKYDVGYKELLDLYKEYEKISIIDLGKFADDRYLGDCAEARKIKSFIEENGIKMGR